MPGPGQDFYQMLWALLTQPAFKGVIPGVLFELRRPGRNTSFDGPDDESIASFLSRRLGSSAPVDNLVSAIIHGIYAGDIYQLSAASLMPEAYAREEIYGGFFAAIGNFVRQGKTGSISRKDHTLLNEMRAKLGPDMKAMMQGASVYSFKKGVSTLSNALETYLRANPNVTIDLGKPVEELVYDGKTQTIDVSIPSQLVRRRQKVKANEAHRLDRSHSTESYLQPLPRPPHPLFHRLHLSTLSRGSLQSQSWS